MYLKTLILYSGFVYTIFINKYETLLNPTNRLFSFKLKNSTRHTIMTILFYKNFHSIRKNPFDSKGNFFFMGSVAENNQYLLKAHVNIFSFSRRNKTCLIYLYVLYIFFNLTTCTSLTAQPIYSKKTIDIFVKVFST